MSWYRWRDWRGAVRVSLLTGLLAMGGCCLTVVSGGTGNYPEMVATSGGTSASGSSTGAGTTTGASSTGAGPTTSGAISSSGSTTGGTTAGATGTSSSTGSTGGQLENDAGAATCYDERVGGSLAGLAWSLPCISPYEANSALCNSASMGVEQTATLSGGQAGAVYDITLQFLGVVEPRTYCVDDVPIYGDAGLLVEIDGDPCCNGGVLTGSDEYCSAGDGWNVYTLVVRPPEGMPLTYFLNNGVSQGGYVVALDYQASLSIEEGSTLTLASLSIDDLEINLDAGNPPGLSSSSPYWDYDGQWISMNVLSVNGQGGWDGGCAVKNGDCDGHATCNENAGAIICTCQPGYFGDGCICTPNGG